MGAYRDVLDPPTSVCDVTYWLNVIGQRQCDPKFAAINAAVEATTLNERTLTLTPQDLFIRDNISIDDILVVASVRRAEHVYRGKTYPELFAVITANFGVGCEVIESELGGRYRFDLCDWLDL